VIDVPADATVADVAHALRIPDELPKIVLVNGHEAEDDVRLQPDDVVAMFPPLAGGR
jgi:molybdopterin converting factor small subunit